ncbi:cytochrome c biogenesis CcdA family protein [Salibacterium halotolerans]|uniref:Cytochrome c-type biogenesis protein n=1 Tax=Salibacterium halotolerans TaxID=1884432 RepID=A0A1I5YDT4_9BACI|nr:cytochrome c biogenesis protein CcdA [Salibacterium halotolerans]SFQ42047.1 cytochrome c-type biogenesis protein [Salibacterium halotolerans]
MDPENITLWVALSAGVISFLSPCTLPLFPAYLSYITGMSVKDLQSPQSKDIRVKIFVYSLLFLAGVSTVFLGLGLGASYAGQMINGLLRGDSGLLLQRISGVFIIFMGLYLTGIISVKMFARTKYLTFSSKPAGWIGTFFTGLGFAAGWTPCIGPIFASILTMAASNPSSGLLYSGMYATGFALPFLFFGFFAGQTKIILKYSSVIMKGGGIVLIIMGVLLFTGELTALSAWLLRLVEGTWFENLG